MARQNYNIGLILGIDPCLQCRSNDQLEQIELAFWARFINRPLPDDLTDLLVDSSCYNCLSDHQMLHVALTRLRQALGNSSMDTLVEDITCLKCVDPKRIRAALLFVKLEAWLQQAGIVT